MTVASIMKKNPLTLRADQTVGEAVQALQQHRFRSMPVIDAHGRMIGQFSVHTLLSLLMPKVSTMPGGLRRLGFLRDDLDDLQRRLSHSWDDPVRDHAQTAVDVTHPDSSLTQTVLALYSRQENIPVVDDDGRLVGILSYWDVIDQLVGGTQG